MVDSSRFLQGAKGVVMFTNPQVYLRKWIISGAENPPGSATFMPFISHMACLGAAQVTGSTASCFCEGQSVAIPRDGTVWHQKLTIWVFNIAMENHHF